MLSSNEFTYTLGSGTVALTGAGGTVTQSNVGTTALVTTPNFKPTAAVGATLTIADNDSATFTISPASEKEGNKIGELKGVNLQLTLTAPFDIDTTWTVGYGNKRDVASYELTSNLVTIGTPVPHGLSTGNVVIINNLGAPFNGTYVITVPINSLTSFTYTKVNAGNIAVNLTPVLNAVRIQSGAIEATGGVDMVNDFVNGADYDGNPDTITIPAGSLTGSVRVDFNEEDASLPGVVLGNLVEDNEKFLTLATSVTNLTGYLINKDAASQVTIENDDTATYKINDVAYNESFTSITTEPQGFSVFNKTLSPGGVATIVILGTASPAYANGQTVRVSIGDPNFDGTFTVISGNSNSFVRVWQLQLRSPVSPRQTRRPQSQLQDTALR